MTPSEQQRAWGTVVHTKKRTCSIDNCSEQSSVRTQRNKSLCIEHYFKIMMEPRLVKCDSCDNKTANTFRCDDCIHAGRVEMMTGEASK